MTTASHLFRWRRVLTVGAASVALHYAIIDWGVDQARLQGTEPRYGSVTIMAELRNAPALALLRPASAPPSAPQAPQASAPAPVAQSRAALPSPQVQLSSLPESASAADAALPRYKADLPPSAQLVFDVVRTGADGATGAGQAVIDWRQAGGEYRVSMSSDVAGSTLTALASEGATGPGGIVPRLMSAQRRGKAATATHIDARRRRITFSASQNSVAMAAGTQDRATVPMQLAGIGRAGGQLGAQVVLMVAEEKGVSLLHFAVVGQEDINTQMGTLATWRLAYSPAPGTYRSRLEVWLAPGHAWYPVQLRSTEANGAVTTQTINRIVANEVGTRYAQ